MLRVGMFELLFIFLLIFLLFGPQALPQIARSIAEFLKSVDKFFKSGE